MYRQAMASTIHQTVVPHNQRLERPVTPAATRHERAALSCAHGAYQAHLPGRSSATLGDIDDGCAETHAARLDCFPRHGRDPRAGHAASQFVDSPRRRLCPLHTAYTGVSCIILIVWMLRGGAESSLWNWLPPFWPISRSVPSSEGRWLVVLAMVAGAVIGGTLQFLRQ